ncbi:MAG TPA: hypothetical protein PLK31_12215 [Chloroflexota bacterium]|nr:hypothetical protein [Chloroflexota bacterium]
MRSFGQPARAGVAVGDVEVYPSVGGAFYVTGPPTAAAHAALPTNDHCLGIPSGGDTPQQVGACAKNLDDVRLVGGEQVTEITPDVG